jgi:serine/threonine-protein kinase
MTGSIVLHYRVEERLGAGGMALVYKALDTKLKRQVALKFLPPAAAADAEYRARLIREATTASSLDHQNICTIYEINEVDGQLFVAMAYYPGRTLKAILADGPLPVDRAVRYAMQICAGLDQAHARDIVHRDIKPANLIITPDDVLKIVDFGLARSSDGSTLTHTGSVLGTMAYMSPEQVSGGGVDGRSDLWAVGVVLYEMVSGIRPFGSSITESTPWAILKNPPPPLTLPAGHVPPHLSAVINKALQKLPDDRYQTAAQFLADLRDLGSGSTSLASLGSGLRLPRAAHAIAVLPFENLNADRESEYFSDGLTEDLISALGEVSDLRVVSRGSVFEFKGKAQNVRKVGELLNVNSVLEGSVRRSGSRVRIAAQLTNTGDGYQVWSQRYDRDLSDVFELQDEMARTIVSALKLKLEGDQLGQMERHTDNVEAYECYLKGRFHWNKKTPDGLIAANDFFTKALSHDPRYALAYCGLADYHVLLAGLWLARPDESWPKAKSAAMKALELNPQLAEPHVSLGRVLFFSDWDWEGARREFETALALRPGFVEARSGYTYYFMAMNQLDRALAQIRSALSVDPLSISMNAVEAMILTYLGQHTRAIKRCREALDLEPTFVELYYTLGLACQQEGRFEEAAAAFQKGREVSGNNPLLTGWLGACRAAAGDRDAALVLLDELVDAERTRSVSPLAFAVLYTGLGDHDKAFEWLNRAADARDALLCYIQVVPTYNPLRADPRYRQLLQRMRLV